MNNQEKINAWFARFEHRMNEVVPNIIAETANEHYRGSFTRKSWDNSPWAQTKKPNKKGTLMVRTPGGLASTIRPSTVSPSRVTISAGSSKVSYARVHNEGGLVTRAARSETFVRNRNSKRGKVGQFKRGTTRGQGFTFKAYRYNMPKRQFMGHSAIVNRLIITRIKQVFNQH